jgi:DNA-binding transcriptional LysR family regulator
MKISLDHLLVIDAIVRRGSFARAAAELHRVPSALTYSVNKLEQDLGVQIFDRSGHRARLTDTGKELLREGRDLLQAAMRLESHLQFISRGWEPELRIAVGDLVSSSRFKDLISEFFQIHGSRTRVRLSQEVYGGSWDALANDRADLSVGAPLGIPPGGGYMTQALQDLNFLFVIRPDHPLAKMPEPLGARLIQSFRAVSAADSSRSLPPRTSGLLSGQEVFAVENMWQKRIAQLKGLGVGFLPEYIVANDIAAGRLLSRRVEESREPARLMVAWRSDSTGKALTWFQRKLADPATKAQLFANIDPAEYY